MSNQLEINLKIGEKEHRLAIDRGDQDGAREALDRVGFMVDLFINNGFTPSKRVVSRQDPVPKRGTGAAGNARTVNPAGGEE